MKDKFQEGLSDSSLAIQIQKDMLSSTGVWPKRNLSFLDYLRFVIQMILAVGLNLVQGIEVVTQIADVIKLAEILYIFMSCFTYCVKLLCFLSNRKIFLDLVDMLKEPIFSKYPIDYDHYMATTIKHCRILANVYRFMCLLLIIMLGVYPIADHKYLPFALSYDVGIYRYPLYAFEMLAIFFAAWNNSCLDTLIVSLMSLGSAHLDILREKITLSLNGNNSEEEICKDLKECIIYHQAVIKYIERIDHVFRAGNLAQFLTSIIIICNTLFDFVLMPIQSTQTLMLVDYLALVLIQFAQYCWFGNNITVKSTRIIDACYMSNWYTCGNKVAKYLNIIMERSRKPLYVTVWKFSRLSLSAFMSVLQWSYSYLALLLKLYRKKFT